MARRGRVVAALPAIVLAACNPFAGSTELEPMTLVPAHDSKVSVTRDGETLEVTDTFPIQPGDVITTSAAGAEVNLSGERRAEMAAHTSLRVSGGQSLEAVSGSLLVTVAEPIQVAFEGVEATARAGVFRIDSSRATSTSTATSYSGSVRISEGGPTVEPLFELDVTEGVLGDLNPVDLSDDDPWADDYLGDAIKLNATLRDFEDSLRALLAGRRAKSALEEILADAPPRIRAGADSAADALIAYGIAHQASGGIAEQIQRVWQLHSHAVPWGAVASIVDSDPSTLLSELETMGTQLVNAAAPGISSSESGSGSVPVHRPKGGSCSSIIDCILDR